MKCPFCGEVGSEVLESRIFEDGLGIRRRRECLNCSKRFTTFERVKGSVLWVIKKDGRRELFEREKIKRGLVRALQKRPFTNNQIEEILNDLERGFLRGEEQEISSKSIGEAVLDKLKIVDKVAWLRFASVYKEFENLDDFEKLIKIKK